MNSETPPRGLVSFPVDRETPRRSLAALRYARPPGVERDRFDLVYDPVCGCDVETYSNACETAGAQRMRAGPSALTR